MGGIRKSLAHIFRFPDRGFPGFFFDLSLTLSFLISEGMFLARYKVLRENGHSPSEAFNEMKRQRSPSSHLSAPTGTSAHQMCQRTTNDQLTHISP
jgi:hypothetical protein